MKPEIFLDMDGVIVDYVVNLSKLFNVPLDVMYSRWPAGVYSVHAALGVTDENTWKIIDGEPDEIWSTMPQYQWSRKLFDYCKAAGDTYILSAPRDCPGCFSGKAKWIYEFAGTDFDKIHLTKFKWHCARYDRILIDDKEQNIAEWEEHGGHGILFPNHGNKLHRFKTDPLSHVIPELDRLTAKIKESKEWKEQLKTLLRTCWRKAGIG